MLNALSPFIGAVMTEQNKQLISYAIEATLQRLIDQGVIEGAEDVVIKIN